MTATPIEPPACWVVDSTPEAAAACSGFTRASTMAGIGAITRPMPIPETTSPGMSQPAPSCRLAASSRYPADTTSDAEGQHLRAEPGRDLARLHRGREVAEAERQEDQPGLQRRQPQAVLQEEREHQEERGHHHLVGEVGDHPRAERPLPEQGQVDQRGAVPGGEPALAQGEGAEQRDRGRQADEDPGRPALLLALHQRQHDRDESERDQRGADEIDPAGARCARDSGSRRGARATAATPIGMLIRKIDRQPSPARSTLDQDPADELSEYRAEADRSSRRR